MTRLGQLVARRPWTVLLVWAVLAIVFGGLGSGLQDRLANRGYDVPGSSSERAAERARAFSGEETTRVYVALTSARRAAARLRSAAAQIGPRLRGVKDLVAVEPPVLGRDGRAALVPVILAVDEAEAQHRVGGLRDRLRGIGGRPVESAVVGHAAVFDSYSTIAREDLSNAERFAFPVTLTVLLVAFLSVIAAVLPLALAGVTLAITFGVLYLLSLTSDMSVFVTNTALFLGVALSIDYSLFLVTRYREGLGQGLSVDDAVIEAVRTAGRTVLVSALTVAASLTCLLAVGVGIFSSMTYGASGTAILAGLAAVTLLPAALKLLGPRIDRLALRPAVSAARRGRLWWRIGDLVIRRRVVIAVGIVALLTVMSIPAAGIELDARATNVLPASDGVRLATERIAASLGEAASAPVEVYTRSDPRRLGEALARTPGVAGASAPEHGHRGDARILVSLADPPESKAAERTVRRIRAVAGPEAAVGGPTAQGLDLKTRVEERIPVVITVAVALALVLLGFSLRSILVPIKAVITTLLSVGAALGTIALGYDLFAGTRTMTTFVPLFLFAIVFGLAVDYELFLLSRVREEYEASGDNDAAIRTGLARSGRQITLAAVVMMSVFLAFGASSLVPLRQVGLGLALAVLIDATLVRTLLVPATLSLLGDRNWWFPLRRGAR